MASSSFQGDFGCAGLITRKQQRSGQSQVVYLAKLSHKASPLQGKYIIVRFLGEPCVSLHGDADTRASVRREKVVGEKIGLYDSAEGEFDPIKGFKRQRSRGAFLRSRASTS